MTCQVQNAPQNAGDLIFVNPDEASTQPEEVAPENEALPVKTSTYYFFLEFSDMISDLMDIKDTAVIKSREAEGEEKMEDVFKELGLE